MNNTKIIEKKYREAVQGIKEEWFQTISTQWYDYIIGLPVPLQITYLVVVLHNQVLNGGFHQYFVNTYGQFARDTINALIEIGAFKKAELLKEALKKVNVQNYNDKIFRENILKKQIKALFETDDLYDPLDKLDNEYYKSESEDIDQLLGNYLQSR